MPDFTSALYLGLRHARDCLEPWQTLTEGRPAALGEVAGAPQVARRLAHLTGAARGLLFPSTLHLFLDLFETLGRRPIAVLWDEGLYPVVRWAIDRAVGTGALALTFDQHRPDTLARALAPHAATRTPVIVTTGFCADCGALAPLAALLERAEALGGYLVIDDTQMFGLLGARSGDLPLGRAGGGAARFLALSSERLLVGVSLAKAFGAPVAFLGGAARVITDVARHGSTRWHASPVCAVGVAAAAHALDVNEARGDELRGRLSALSTRFARGLGSLAPRAAPPVLPMQSTVPLPRPLAEALHAAIESRGVRCLLQRVRRQADAKLTFLITTDHDDASIDEAISAVQWGWRSVGARNALRAGFECSAGGRL